MTADSAHSSPETTFGTDPWAGADETLFDRTDWEARGNDLVSRLDAFEQTLTSLDAEGRDDGEEVRRLQEVVERLQARIYELEDLLTAERTARKQAKQRMLKLAETIESWKPSEP